MVQFGSQFTKEEAEGTTTGTGSGRYIKYFKNSQTTLRFLEEMAKTEGVPSPWTMYWEHYSTAKQRSYPCLGKNNGCPGCEAGDRSSKRYLVNALSGGYVDVWKIPASIIDDLVRKSDRDGGTIRARDFTIYKTGTGMQTEYGVENEDKEKIDLDAYAGQMQDHQEALTEAFTEAWGMSPADFLAQERDEGSQDRPEPKEEERPRRASSTGALRESVKQESNQQKDLDDLDNHIEELRAARKPAIKKAEPEPEEEVLTEESVRAMNTDDLIELYIRCGVTPPETTDQEKLADYLIDALSE